MSDYQDIRGTRVKYLTSDPTLESSYEGQIWYNSTTGINKALVKIRAFSSGGTVPTRFYYPGAVGGTTDTLGIAGVGPSPQPAHNLCIEYSGFSWSAQPNLNTNRRAPYTFGTSTSCVASGGDYSPASPTLTQATEEWNGSSWTSVTNMPNNQGSFGAASGTLTAGLVYGGYGNPQSTSAKTVSYDGTNWTDLSSPGSDVVNGRNFTRGGGGTQTAAIFSGGNPTTGNTETFDGSSWSEQNNMSLARYGSGFIGTQTSGLYMGGRTPPRTGVTEDWDGSVWSTTASMATARNGTIHSKSGNASAAIVAAGYTGTAYPTTTEEYNANINAITKAAWSSGGALGTSRRYISGCGTKTAIVAFGGFKPGSANETELYNGSSWSEVNNLGTAGYGVGAAGTQTAALAFGGSNDVYESWDGSNWTSSSALNTTRRMLGSCGTQTAALAFGGRPEPSSSAKTEEWNGSSWSNSNDLNTAVRNNMGSGIQTAALNSGGNTPSNDTLTGSTEEYNGTSWTASPGTMNTARMASAPNTGGLQTAALVYGGLPPASAVTEQYDGTSWSATASMATARGQTGGGGTSTAGIVYGGSPPGSGGTDATEEFTGGTETVTASTLTTS
jgi:hypothetical protein